MPDVVIRSVYRTSVVMDGVSEATRSDIPVLCLLHGRWGGWSRQEARHDLFQDSLLLRA